MSESPVKWTSPDDMWSKLSHQQKHAIMMAVAAFQQPSPDPAVSASPGRAGAGESRKKAMSSRVEAREEEDAGEPKRQRTMDTKAAKPAVSSPKPAGAFSGQASPARGPGRPPKVAREGGGDKGGRASKEEGAPAGKPGLREKRTPQWVGATLVKLFDGVPFKGEVVSVTAAEKTAVGTALYRIVYTDGDSEDMTLDELLQFSPRMPGDGRK